MLVAAEQRVFARSAALMHAVVRNDPEKIAALIKAGVLLDETDEGETALHWAVSRQHTEIVTMLLDAGANPNVADNDGYTPLHDLAEMGDCPPARTMLEALLAAGADPSRQEKNGRTHRSWRRAWATPYRDSRRHSCNL